MKTISILGAVGIPASYGGFETLAENLAKYHQAAELTDELVVYCSSNAYSEQPSAYCRAKLRYVGLDANGASSILHDIVSLFSAVHYGSNVIVLLGVSGALVLPIIRLISKVHIVTNIDGIEWKRKKWNSAAKWFLRLSERFAVRFSHQVVTDNKGIAAYVVATYGRDCHVIAYGGDHAVQAEPKHYEGVSLPRRYALALCRIEPENNVALILEAFARTPKVPLVFIGNWSNSNYGRQLKRRYAWQEHLYLLDPIYDLGVLRTLRCNASLYVHGHSAGGTNPSLVEIMHFGLPVFAFDCNFNRFTTEDKAIFFKDAEELRTEVNTLTPTMAKETGKILYRIARKHYTWDKIGKAYFDLLV